MLPYIIKVLLPVRTQQARPPLPTIGARDVVVIRHCGSNHLLPVPGMRVQPRYIVIPIKRPRARESRVSIGVGLEDLNTTRLSILPVPMSSEENTIGQGCILVSLHDRGDIPSERDEKFTQHDASQRIGLNLIFPSLHQKGGRIVHVE